MTTSCLETNCPATRGPADLSDPKSIKEMLGSESLATGHKGPKLGTQAYLFPSRDFPEMAGPTSSLLLPAGVWG